jgi:hypothetical protein
MLHLGVLALLVGLLAGGLRGGSPARLLTLKLRHAWLVAVAFGVQAVLLLTPLERLAGNLAAPLLTLTNLALVAMVVLNIHVPGLKLFAVGLGLNTLVILLNGGFMPVSADALRRAGLDDLVAEMGVAGHSEKSRLIDPATRLPLLGDILPVPAIAKVFSVGDIFVVAGATWLVAAGMGRAERSQSVPMAEVANNDGGRV